MKSFDSTAGIFGGGNEKDKRQIGECACEDEEIIWRKGGNRRERRPTLKVYEGLITKTRIMGRAVAMFFISISEGAK